MLQIHTTSRDRPKNTHSRKRYIEPVESLKVFPPSPDFIAFLLSETSSSLLFSLITAETSAADVLLALWAPSQVSLHWLEMSHVFSERQQ